MVSREKALKTAVALLVTQHREYIRGGETEKQCAVSCARTVAKFLYMLEVLNTTQTAGIQNWIDEWDTLPDGPNVEQQVLDLITE